MSLLYWGWTEDRLRTDLAGCDSIIDAGCGKDSMIGAFNCYKIGVDLWQPYIDDSKRKRLHNEYVNGDILEYLKMCKDKSIDGIYFGAVVEHVDAVKGKLFLLEAERVARKKVIVITTNGYIRHEEIDGNPYQAHLSGWYVDYFKSIGYEVYGLFGIRPLRGEAGVTKIKPVILGETISNLTQYFTYKHPNYAFELYAVRDTRMQAVIVIQGLSNTEQIPIHCISKATELESKGYHIIIIPEIKITQEDIKSADLLIRIRADGLE